MSGPVVVTAKLGPDLDGVACTIAYAELLRAVGTSAVAVVAGRPDAEARYVITAARATHRTTSTDDVGGVVLVDASDTAGLPAFVEPDAVIEVIDHREHHQANDKFRKARVQVEAVGAAATLIFERYVAAGVVPTDVSATLLHAAIHSNTQRFRGTITTHRDIVAADQLERICPLPPRLVDAMFEARRSEIIEDVGFAVQRESKSFEHAESSFVLSQLECPGAIGLVDDVLAHLNALGPRAGVNLVDPEVPASVLVVVDPAFRAWIAARSGLDFEGIVARPTRVILRKQIIARIFGVRP